MRIPYLFLLTNIFLILTFFILMSCSQNQYKKNEIFYFPSTGQSNSVGGGGESKALSKKPMFNNLYKYTHGPSILPLIEPVMSLAAAPQKLYDVETHISAMANNLEYQIRKNKTLKRRIMIFGSHGQGGRNYEWIKKGGGGISYQDTLNAISFLKEKHSKSKFKLIVPGVIFIHGENDAQEKNKNYFQNLMELQENYENDIKDITGQSTPVLLFLTQTIGDINVFGGSNSSMAVKMSQLKSSQKNKKIILVGPTYMIPPGYITNFHFDNFGYRRLGEYFGKVIKYVIFDKKTWTPLSPKNFTLNNNLITIDFNVPVLPIRFDHNIKIPDEGFKIFDGDKPINISSIKISSPSSIQITLENKPKQNKLEISYGFERLSNYPNGGGTIMDSDNSFSLYKNSLANYLVQFKYEFINDKSKLD